jgi:hypothetical protein
MFGRDCAESTFDFEVGQPLTGGHKVHSGHKARKFGMKSIQGRPATFLWGVQSTKYPCD